MEAAERMLKKESKKQKMSGNKSVLAAAGFLRLFLCGDVMTGRGVDQIMHSSCSPELYEGYVEEAGGYVRLAEQKTGTLPRSVEPSYVWGDALRVWTEYRPDLKIINLETAVTTSNHHWPSKGIHYRMHPVNAASLLRTPGIDCCVLANNHVLDWGRQGALETLETIEKLSPSVKICGLGRNRDEAKAPAVFRLPSSPSSDANDSSGKNLGRVLVFGYAEENSGVPREWAATGTAIGLNFLPHGISTRSADQIAQNTAKFRQPGDVVVVSIHWGGNWGFEVSQEDRDFAHQLIDSGAADIVHGHSSHHVKPFEVYKGKLILYGCGDFLNDYEGIGSERGELFRDDLTLMYFAELDPRKGILKRLIGVPMQIKHFRLNDAPDEGATWLFRTLRRECAAQNLTGCGKIELNRSGRFLTLYEQEKMEEEENIDDNKGDL